MPVGADCRRIRFHVDGSAVDIDVLFGRDALVGGFDLDCRRFGRIAHENVVGRLDAALVPLDGDVATGDLDNALVSHSVLEFTPVVFYAFVTFEAVARLGGDVQGAARNFETALALDAVIACHHGDIAILDLEIVAGLDTVLEVTRDGQLSGTLDVQVVLGINRSLCSVLLAVDGCEQVIALAVFHDVDRTLYQVYHRLVGVLHENRGIGALQSRIV